MEAYKKEFIEFMVDCQVLKFGDFVTKSGRKTPFFVNTGFYRTGAQLRRLGQYYAEAVNSKFGLDFDVLFGPAYKGIPLSVAATIARVIIVPFLCPFTNLRALAPTPCACSAAFRSIGFKCFTICP